MDILFVCLGNICRSPAAEGVALALRNDFPWLDSIDSAGTGPWHVGEAPHGPMRKVAQEFGFNLDALRARQVSQADFFAFDVIIAMDRQNLADLQALQPQNSRASLRLLLENQDVPDPYGKSLDSFRDCFELIRQGVLQLFHELDRVPRGTV